MIDDDLGVSAAAADSRKGFARLVTEVTMGRAGIVLGIEMSRLARTGRDWHQLLELCSLSGVLLADPDGVYDPGVYNDRLLLGLKGTMSEAELYLIRQRMLSGRLAKAERGELAVPLPIGYVRRPSGEAVLDPDEQAQHVVRLVARRHPQERDGADAHPDSCDEQRDPWRSSDRDHAPEHVAERREDRAERFDGGLVGGRIELIAAASAWFERKRAPRRSCRDETSRDRNPADRRRAPARAPRAKPDRGRERRNGRRVQA